MWKVESSIFFMCFLYIYFFFGITTCGWGLLLCIRFVFVFLNEKWMIMTENPKVILLAHSRWYKHLFKKMTQAQGVLICSSWHQKLNLSFILVSQFVLLNPQTAFMSHVLTVFFSRLNLLVCDNPGRHEKKYSVHCVMKN